VKSKKKALVIRSSSHSNSDINVTPLVDVVLVLLIIFMVVTPLLEKDIGVQVPETEKADVPDEVPPDQIVVRVAAGDELFINQDKVTPAEYVDNLKNRFSRLAPGKKLVFIMADDGALYARLVSALDGAKQAGADTLAMAGAIATP
jgi:biopolymer transport protein TolR